MLDIASFIVEYLWLITLAIQIIILILHGVIVKLHMKEINLKHKKTDEDEKEKKKKEKPIHDMDNVKTEVDNKIERLKTEFSQKIAEYDKNQKALIKTIDSLVLQIKNKDETYVKSLNEILDTLELSEEQKQKINEKLNSLKMELSQPREETLEESE